MQPENLLLASKEKGACVKLADFGLAVEAMDGKHYYGEEFMSTIIIGSLKNIHSLLLYKFGVIIKIKRPKNNNNKQQKTTNKNNRQKQKTTTNKNNNCNKANCIAAICKECHNNLSADENCTCRHIYLIASEASH